MWQGLIKRKAETATTAESLRADEFAAQLQAFAPLSQPFALAVSGGPDSMALAYCVQRWLKDKNQTAFAFIVDHGLRTQSRKEAEETQKRLRAMGFQTEILSWEHAPVVTRLHATARKARYELLTQACKKHHIRDLFLAHHKDDQAETILMRLAKGSGIDGLAGMRAQKMVKDVRLLRPFLSVTKDRLKATCIAAKLLFVEDASNISQKFARGRLRRILPLLAEEGLTIERLSDLGERAGDAKAALDHYTQQLLQVATKRDATGVIHFNLEHLRSGPRAIAERALILCLQSVHPQNYPPERSSLLPILDALCADEEMAPRTLHGCLITKQSAEASFMREYADISDAPLIHPGESIIWDQRWQITLSKKAPDKAYTTRALGNPPYDVIDRLAPGLREVIPKGRARATMPSLWVGGTLSIIPSFGPTVDFQGLANKSAGAEATLLTPWPPR